MAESGCLRDMAVQNLEVQNLDTTSNIKSSALSTATGHVGHLNTKSAVAGGAAFTPTTLVANTNYIVTGELNTTAVTLPTPVIGSTITIEFVSATAGALGIANGQAVTFTTSNLDDFFEANSYIKAITSAATNGGVVVGMSYDYILANGTNHNRLTLSGLTDSGPGVGSFLKFSCGRGSGATGQWRLEGEVTSSGAQTGAPLTQAAFSNVDP